MKNAKQLRMGVEMPWKKQRPCLQPLANASLSELGKCRIGLWLEMESPALAHGSSRPGWTGL